MSRPKRYLEEKKVLDTIKYWWRTAIIADGQPTLCDEIRALPTVPAVPLDRIKETREEVANYSDFHREHLFKTNPNYDVEQGQYLAYEKCLQIIDDLIAEVEETNEL